MSTQKNHRPLSLQLAVTVATLGMSMGINPNDALAMPAQAERLPDETTAVTPRPLQLAAGYLKYDGIDGEANEKRGAMKSGGTITPRVEKSETPPAKAKRPGAMEFKEQKFKGAYVGDRRDKRKGARYMKEDRSEVTNPSVNQK